MMKKLILAVLAFCIVNTGQIFAQDKKIEKKIERLLKKMTLEEKIGQMNQYSSIGDLTGPAPTEGNQKKRYEDIKKGRVGSMLNISNVDNVRAYQKMAVEESRLGIPLIFGLDVVHGYYVATPIPLAEAASWDLEAIEKSARFAAIEASASGVNWTFAPMVDISYDARWGRVMEGGGEDTYLGSKIAYARVKGFQGDDIGATNTIVACAKHFAGYGFSEAGRDYNTVDIGTARLHNVVLPPFKACVDAGVRTFMNSFNILNGVPATGNSFLQRDILKGKWGFDGFVVSDWGSQKEMISHGYATDLKDVAVKASIAGSDMDMESSAYIAELKKAVEEGKVPMAVIDEAVTRILRVKYELGLFDDPYKYCDNAREKEYLNNPEHVKASLDIAKKSIVLLKNRNDLLPLKKEGLKIALIGDLADDKDSPLGNWRALAKANTAVSVVEGMNEYKDNEVTFAQGVKLNLAATSFGASLKINYTDTTGFGKAIDLAKKSDVVVMVLGENCHQSGEARSQTRIGLLGLQLELLKKVYEVNKKVVLVLMNGRPLAIPWAAKNIPSIVEAWHLGSQSGNAIAQVLYGDYNPSGKLPMSFPRNVGQVPIYYNHFNTGRPFEPGDLFTSKYTDEPNTPLFPFGHGLSYTKFNFSGLKIDDADKKNVKVKVDIKNYGKVKGKEVAQLYIWDKAASVVRPVKELKGFKMIELAPGETKTIEFVLTEKELGFYNQKGEFVVEPGEFEIMVGPSSDTKLRGSFVLK